MVEMMAMERPLADIVGIDRQGHRTRRGHVDRVADSSGETPLVDRDDLELMPDDGRRYELIDGVLAVRD